MERRELSPAAALPQSSGAPQQHQMFSWLVYGLLLLALLVWWRKARRRRFLQQSSSAP